MCPRSYWGTQKVFFNVASFLTVLTNDPDKSNPVKFNADLSLNLKAFYHIRNS